MEPLTPHQSKTIGDIISQHGDWTAMSIHLGANKYTLMPPRHDYRLRRLMQIATDLSLRPLRQLRVLDLACLEGQYGIEFALHGANVTGIEIRDANLEKARFAKNSLGLTNIDFVKDDVRNLSKEKYGLFDIVICSGILYHLPGLEACKFVKNISEVCTRLAIIDTQIGLYDNISFDFEGRRYSGIPYIEHKEGSTESERQADLWASIDNTQSIWLTHASLANLIANVGFSSFYECHNPSSLDQPDDRRTYVAVKGERAKIHSSPPTDTLSQEDWPEHRARRVNAIHLLQERPVRRFLKRILPGPVKSFIKPALRTVGMLEPDPTPKWVKK